MPPKGRGRGKTAAGYQHASEMPKGTEMIDLRKKSWFLGEPIGSGGFGLIYLADENKDTTVKGKAKYVIKVEPQANGPLFCEISFYQRAATLNDLASWKRENRIPHVGIPAYVSHGLHTNGKEKLRFLVMPRFGCDLHNLWLKADKKFRRDTVCQVAIELINSLEYLHARQYIHADVKGANILTGHNDANKVYLVDFGLVCRYTIGEKHKEYKEEPAKAHDGTIEYTSRDAHLGVAPSRRSDLEILGYVLLHWLSGKLPWDDNLANKNYVKEQKIKHMGKIREFVASVYPEAKSNKEIEKYFQTVSNLKYDEQPDYDLLRKYFQDALKSMGVGLKAKICFEGQDGPAPAKKRRANQPQAKPLASATNSQVRQSDEEEIAQTRKPKQARMKLKNESSSEHEASNMNSTTASNETPLKTPRPRKKPVSSLKKAGQRKKIPKKIPPAPLPSDSSFQSDEEEFLPTRNLKRTRLKRKVIRSSEEEASIESEETPVKMSASSVKKSVQKKRTATNVAVSPADTSVSALTKRSTEGNIVTVENVISSTSKKVVRSGRKAWCPSKVAEASSSTPTGDEVNATDSIFDSPNLKQKRVTRSSDVKNEVPLQDSVGPTVTKSRYSMAPLHTESVLGKYDKLTGKTSGKHPVIIRRRKVKRPKSDAETQTTPSLSKRASRV